MLKTSFYTQAMTADGKTVSIPLGDFRQEKGPWPIKFGVPVEQAGHWLQHLQAECGPRGWGYSSTSEANQKENSGSITIRAGAIVPCPELIVVWKRRRGGTIGVKARPAGTPELDRPTADEFFARVNDRARLNQLEKIYCRREIYYDGLPWLGELWLDDSLRLGPPSRQYEEALCGPRVILVDAEVEAIDGHDAGCVFDLKLRELSVFLSIVMRTSVECPKLGREWVFDVLPDGQANSEARQLGYHEPNRLSAMPAKGTSPPIPLHPVSRPDFSEPVIYCEWKQEKLPWDVVDLWRAYTSLSDEARRRFLQAGNLYRRAISLGRDEQTLRVALMVVTCEALKLPEQKYDGHNAASVVQALLGNAAGAVILGKDVHPLGVRNMHLHRGEFKGGEFLKLVTESSDRDPTFDQRSRELGAITCRHRRMAEEGRHLHPAAETVCCSHSLGPRNHHPSAYGSRGHPCWRRSPRLASPRPICRKLIWSNGRGCHYHKYGWANELCTGGHCGRGPRGSGLRVAPGLCSPNRWAG